VEPPGTSWPNETRFLLDVPVPGVRSMPGGLDGVSDDLLVTAVAFLKAAPRTARRSSVRFDGVPNKALLKALAANTGAGVSG
jgi:hypothetical protein